MEGDEEGGSTSRGMGGSGEEERKEEWVEEGKGSQADRKGWEEVQGGEGKGGDRRGRGRGEGR